LLGLLLELEGIWLLGGQVDDMELETAKSPTPFNRHKSALSQKKKWILKGNSNY
jgi:hypothetical protein